MVGCIRWMGNCAGGGSGGDGDGGGKPNLVPNFVSANYIWCLMKLRWYGVPSTIAWRLVVRVSLVFEICLSVNNKFSNIWNQFLPENTSHIERNPLKFKCIKISSWNSFRIQLNIKRYKVHAVGRSSSLARGLQTGWRIHSITL